MVKSLTTKIRKKARIFPLNTDFQYHTKDPSKCNKTSKGNEGMQIGKKDIKLTLFAEDMTMQNIQQWKDSMIKLELNSNYSKAA